MDSKSIMMATTDLNKYISKYDCRINEKLYPNPGKKLIDLKQALHFICSKQIPDTKSEFTQLRYLDKDTQDIEIQNIQNEMKNKVNSTIQSPDLETLEQLFQYNISLITHWYYLVCDPFYEQKNSKLRINNKIAFDKAMASIINEIDEKYASEVSEVKIEYTIIESMEILITRESFREFGANLEKLFTKDRLNKFLPSIQPVINSIQNLVNIISMALSERKERPDVVTAIDYNGMVEVREILSQFAFYTGHIDIISKRVYSFASTVSQMLYHIDHILCACTALPRDPCPAFSISIAASTIEKFGRNFDVPEITRFVELCGKTVNAFKGYDTSHPGTRTQLMGILKKIIAPMENSINKVLIADELFNNAFWMIVSESALLQSLDLYHKRIDLKSSKEIGNEISNDLDNLQKYVCINSGATITNYNSMELTKYFINTSKVAKSYVTKAQTESYQNQTDDEKRRLIDEAKYKLININEQMEKAMDVTLINNFEDPLKRFKSQISKTYAIGDIDCDLPQKRDLDSMLEETIKKHTELVEKYSNDLMATLPDPSTLDQVRMTTFVLNLINEDLKYAQKMTEDEALIRDIRRIAREIKRMISTFQDLENSGHSQSGDEEDIRDEEYNGFNDSKLVNIGDQIQRDLEFLSGIQNASQISDTARECNFEKDLMNLTDCLSLLVMCISNFQKEKFKPIDVVGSLYEAVDAMNELFMHIEQINIKSIKFTEFLTKYKNILGVLAEKIRNDPAPKKYIPYLTVIRREIEKASSVLRLMGSKQPVSEILGALSKARWQLTHQESDYANDKAIREKLMSTYKYFDSIVGKLGGSNRLAQSYLDQKSGIEKIVKFYSPDELTERIDGYELDQGDVLYEVLQNIYSYMCQTVPKGVNDDADRIRKIINNEVLILLNLEPFTLKKPVNELDRFKGTIFYDYMCAVAEVQGVPAELLNTCSSLDNAAADDAKIEELIRNFTEKLNGFIVYGLNPNINRKIIDIIFPMLIFISNYKKHLNASNMIEYVLNTSKQPEIIITEYCKLKGYLDIERIEDSMLLSNLIRFYNNPQQQSLPDTIYYTKLITKRNPKIFEPIIDQLYGCFGNEEDITNINFDRAIAFLNQESIKDLKVDFGKVLNNPRTLGLLATESSKPFDEAVLKQLILPPFEKLKRTNRVCDARVLIDLSKKVKRDISIYKGSSDPTLQCVGVNALADSVLKMAEMMQTFSRRDDYEELKGYWNAAIEQALSLSFKNEGSPPDSLVYTKQISQILESVCKEASENGSIERIGDWSSFWRAPLETARRVSEYGDPVFVLLLRKYFDGLQEPSMIFGEGAETISPEFGDLAKSLNSSLGGLLDSLNHIERKEKPSLTTFKKYLNEAKNALSDIIERVREKFDGSDFSESIKEGLERAIKVIDASLSPSDYASAAKIDLDLFELWRSLGGIPLLLRCVGLEFTASNALEDITAARVVLRRIDSLGEFDVGHFRSLMAACFEEAVRLRYEGAEEIESVMMCAHFLVDRDNRKIETAKYLMWTRDDVFAKIVGGEEKLCETLGEAASYCTFHVKNV